MTGGIDRNDATLWRRWRESSDAEGEAALEPDTIVLAAYAEKRLGRPDVDPEFDSNINAVEEWLASHSDALDDVLEAKQDAVDVGSLTSAAILGRALKLVAEPQANVIAFRARRNWRQTAAWSGIAASVVAASLVGFSIGLDDWLSLTGGNQTQAYDQELLGPSTPLLGGSEEDSAT